MFCRIDNTSRAYNFLLLQLQHPSRSALLLHEDLMYFLLLIIIAVLRFSKDWLRRLFRRHVVAKRQNTVFVFGGVRTLSCGYPHLFEWQSPLTSMLSKPFNSLADP